MIRQDENFGEVYVGEPTEFTGNAQGSLTLSFADRIAAVRLRAGSSRLPNLTDAIGETLPVVGVMLLDPGASAFESIEHRVVVATADGRRFQSCAQSAIADAEVIVGMLGEEPYPVSVEMEVYEVETKHGVRPGLRVL